MERSPLVVDGRQWRSALTESEVFTGGDRVVTDDEVQPRERGPIFPAKIRPIGRAGFRPAAD